MASSLLQLFYPSSVYFSAHGELEAVSVSVVMYPMEGTSVTLGSSSVTYKQDLACELASFLVHQVDCLSPTSHHALLSRFGLTTEELQSLDHDIMLAMAHEEMLMLPTWNIIGKSLEDGRQFSVFSPRFCLI